LLNICAAVLVAGFIFMTIRAYTVKPPGESPPNNPQPAAAAAENP
jgi:hypothetical protein